MLERPSDARPPRPLPASPRAAALRTPALRTPAAPAGGHGRSPRPPRPPRPPSAASPGLARAVSLALWAVAAVSWPLLVAVQGLPPDPFAEPSILLGPLLVAAYVAAHALARTGRTRAAGHTVAAATLAVLAAAQFVPPGRAGSAGAPFLLSIVPLLSGLLLSPRAARGYVAAGGAAMAAAWPLSTPLALKAMAAVLLAGTAAAVLAFNRLRDLTDRTLRRQEAELRQRTSFLEAVLNAGPDALVVMDDRLRLLAWNRRGGVLLRQAFGAEARAGVEILRRLPPAWLPGAASLVLTTLYGASHEVGVEVRRAGRVRAFDLALEPFSGAGGRLGGVVVRARDRTRERALARGRVAAREGARALARSRALGLLQGDLLLATSREVNTCLTPILLQSGVLAQAAATPPGIRRGLEVIDRNARRLRKLAGDVVELVRMQRDPMWPESGPVDLGILLADAAGAWHGEAARRQVRLAVEPTDAWAWCDAAKVGWAVRELVANAIRWSRPGGSVRVRAEARDGQVQVTVADDGRGYDPALRRELFVPFGRLPKPQEPAAGNGLGLALVKGIAEAHGGEVGSASPGPGQGARFWFTLPRAGPAPPRGVPGPAPGEAVAGVAALERRPAPPMHAAGVG